MEKVIGFIKNHFDFGIYPVTWLAIFCAIAILPCVMFLPEKFGYENGLLENIQMIFLLITLVLGFCAKSNKKLFVFVSLVAIILILREINCGRTIFFPVPNEPNTFYSWKDIEYGWLVHPIFGAYIACVGVYFLWNKLFLNVWEIIKKVKFPVWNILLFCLGSGLGLYAEHTLHNMVFEEITELLMYAALAGLVYLYGFHKNFQIKE